MPQSDAGYGPELDGLRRELDHLALRVANLERQLGTQPETALPFENVLSAEPARVAVEETARAIPALGRSLLGLAGAYLLRAVTESGGMNPRVGVAAGIAYALLWLILAARTPAGRRLETALHSLTSALVLAPLLWEATIRFHAISTWTSAATLLLFTVFGLAVSWRKNQFVVATIATLTGLGAASALLVATHDLMPYTWVLLAIGAAVEASACLDHWLGERWLAAAAADLSVLLATYLMVNPRGLPEGYVPFSHGQLLAAQLALAAIYLSSTIVRTLGRGRTFTTFETLECVAAFVISLGCSLQLAGSDRQAVAETGGAMLICAIACYLVAFRLLSRQGEHGRNFYTYSTFGVVLAIAGIRSLSPDAAVVAWPALAALCVWSAGVVSRTTLVWHGGVFLLAGGVASGAFRQATAALVGQGGLLEADAWMSAAAALACYLLMRRPAERWSAKAARLGVAAVLVWVAAGVAAGGLTTIYHRVLGPSASPGYCDTIRTGVLVAASLLLAWSGARSIRFELSTLMYPLMLVGAYRLIFEDLHQQDKAPLFLSLLLYGASLILLPKLVAPRRNLTPT